MEEKDLLKEMYAHLYKALEELPRDLKLIRNKIDDTLSASRGLYADFIWETIPDDHAEEEREEQRDRALDVFYDGL